MIRRNKNNKKNNYLIGMDNLKPKKTGIIVIAALLMSGMSTSAYAAITNSATAEGTYDKGTSDTADDVTETSDADTATVPVVAVNRELEISSIGTPVLTKTEGDTDFSDVGDTVTFRYTVKNTGNVIEAVSVSAAKPTFKDVDGTVNAGAGSDPESSEISTATEATGVASALEPGEIAVFDLTYTLGVLDAFRAAGVSDGVSLVAKATSTAITNDINEIDPVATAVTATIEAYKDLTLQKLAYKGNSTFDSSTAYGSGSTVAAVDEGDIITYRYIVTNTGNVPLVDVKVTDKHGGAIGDLTYVELDDDDIQNEAISEGETGVLGNTLLSDTSVTSDNDGIIELLAAGAEVILSYKHVVTPEEIFAQ